MRSIYFLELNHDFILSEHVKHILKLIQMRNTSILFIGLLCSTIVSAQVGINSENPKSTLDVVGRPLDINSLDGITAPRLTGDELRAKTYTGEQRGALVFVTVADSAPLGQTIDVIAAGYYYFNGSKWVSTSGNMNNIYNSNGTLTNARTLTLGGQELNFTGAIQRTSWGANGVLYQENLLSSGSSGISLDGGDDSHLWLQQFRNGEGRVQAQENATSLNLATSGNAVSAPVVISTSAGSGALGSEKMRVTGTGEIGINTTGPTEKLDNNGTTRLRVLPQNGANNVIHTTSDGSASGAQNQTFTAVNTVVADANGVLGKLPYLPPLPVVMAGANGADATGSSSITVRSINDVQGEASLTQRTFNVTKKSLVTFSFSVGISSIQQYNGTSSLSDGISKQIGSRLIFSAVPAGSSYTAGNTIVRSAIPFTTASVNSAYGYFYLNGTEILVLTPGSYTVDLRGYVYAKDNGQGISGLFDGGVDSLNIVAIPME